MLSDSSGLLIQKLGSQGSIPPKAQNKQKNATFSSDSLHKMIEIFFINGSFSYG